MVTREEYSRPRSRCAEAPDFRIAAAAMRRLLLGTIVYVLALVILMLF
jgi:hypothetical protein